MLVTALAYDNSFNDWSWLEKLPRLPRVKAMSGDLRDPHFCRSLVSGFDIVYRLAALIPIPYSYFATGRLIRRVETEIGWRPCTRLRDDLARTLIERA